MTKRYTNYSPGQRIEATDAIDVAVDTPVEAIQAIARDLVMGKDDPVQNAVLSGFTCTSSGAGNLTVTNGSAIVGFRREGRTEFGMVLSGGASAKATDLGSLADGTYGVYVRFTFVEGAFGNRFFWNPLAVTPVETPQNVGTRLVEDWSFTVDITPPGPEWLYIASVPVSSGVVGSITDTRTMLLDTITGAITDSEWGAAADRTSPVASIRRAILGLMRQMQDIAGQADWRTTIPTGGALMRNGSRSITGNLLPDSAGIRDLGSSALPMDTLFAQNIVGVDSGSGTSASNLGFMSGDELALTGPGILDPRDLLRLAHTVATDPVGLAFNNTAAAAEQSFIYNTPVAGPAANLTLQAGSASASDFIIADAARLVGSARMTALVLTAAGANVEADDIIAGAYVQSPEFRITPSTASGYRIIAGSNHIATEGTQEPSTASTLHNGGVSTWYDISAVLPLNAEIRDIDISFTGTGTFTVSLQEYPVGSTTPSTVGTGTGPGAATASWAAGGSSIVNDVSNKYVLVVFTPSATNVRLTDVVIRYTKNNGLLGI